MSKISGFSSIEVGNSPIQVGKEYSVAELIDIVKELSHSVDQINIATILSFLAMVPGINNHIANSTIHLTTEQKDALIEIIEDYNEGLLTGGSGGTGTVGLAAVYPTKFDLLSAAGSVGSVAVIQTEPANLYMWDTVTSKWTIKDGNRYSLSTLPSDTEFNIPIGTRLINSDTGEGIVWLLGLPDLNIPDILEIVSLAIDSTGGLLTITLNTPGYNGMGYSDSYFTLSGVVSGDINLTYVSGDGTISRVYSTSSVVYAGDTITFDFSGPPECIISGNDNSLEPTNLILTTEENGSEEVLVEPSYSTLNWLCRDTVLPIVCSQDPYYNGTLSSPYGTNTGQLYKNSDLYGHEDYGFNMCDNNYLPSSLVIPKVLPYNTPMINFEMSAGFFLYAQLNNTYPWILFSIMDATHTIKLNRLWNASSLQLVVNGSIITPTTTSLIYFNGSEHERDYIKLTVNGTAVTATYEKRVAVATNTTPANTEIFNTVIATWNLASAITFMNPKIYYGGDEFTTPPAYHNTHVGDCKWNLL